MRRHTAFGRENCTALPLPTKTSVLVTLTAFFGNTSLTAWAIRHVSSMPHTAFAVAAIAALRCFLRTVTVISICCSLVGNSFDNIENAVENHDEDNHREYRVLAHEIQNFLHSNSLSKL